MGGMVTAGIVKGPYEQFDIYGQTETTPLSRDGATFRDERKDE